MFLLRHFVVVIINILGFSICNCNFPMFTFPEQSKSKSLSYIQYASASLKNAKNLLGYHKNVKSLQTSSNQQLQQQQRQQLHQSSATKTQQQLSNRNTNHNNIIMNNNLDKTNTHQNTKFAQMSSDPIVVGDTNSLPQKTQNYNNSAALYFNSMVLQLKKNTSSVSVGNGGLEPGSHRMPTSTTTSTASTTSVASNLNGAQQTWSYHVLPSLYSIYQKVSIHSFPFLCHFDRKVHGDECLRSSNCVPSLWNVYCPFKTENP